MRSTPVSEVDPMSKPPDVAATTSQLVTFTAKLIEALEDAEALGGLKGLRSKVKASTAAKIADQLKVLRAEIDGQLAELDR
jgi:hypothetical protein